VRGAASTNRQASGALVPVLAVAALLAIVIAVPVALLVGTGSPFAHLGPAQVARAVSTQRNYDPVTAAHWVGRSAVLIAWLAWIWMTVCVALEVRSLSSGRSPVHLPASRTLQSLAACLVGAALALSIGVKGGGLTRTPPATRAPEMAPTTMLRVIDDDRFVLFFGETDRPTAAPAGSEAESSEDPHGGDAVVPIVGAAQTAPPVLAGGGGDAPVPTVELLRPSPVSHVVERRETLWSIANDSLGSALRWSEIADLNYGVVQSDGRALGVDHALRPGWTLELPSTGSALHPDESGTGRPMLTDGVPLTLAGLVSAGPSRPSMWRPAPAPGQPHLPIRVPLTPVGGGVVGAGVVRMVDRMRRAQQRHRGEGMFITLPGPVGRGLEQRLRLGGGSEIIADIDRALCGLTGHELDQSGSWISGVRVRPDVIEVVLDRRDGSKASPDAHGDHIVSVSRPVLGTPRPTAGDARAPAPLLVTAGEGPSGLVMVNLEALGTLTVEGDTEACDGVLRALALELATSLWSDRFDVAVTGLDSGLENFARVTVSEPGLLVDALWRRRMGRLARLDASPFATFAEARASDTSANWDPMVVLCGATVPERQVVELVDIASDPVLGMAVVATGRRPDGEPAARLSTVSPSVELLGAVGTPQHVEADDLAGVASLLETAMRRQSAFSSDEPYVTLPVPLPTAVLLRPANDPPESVETSDVEQVPAGAGMSRPRRTGHSSAAQRAGQVEVAVLGSIEIRGLAREFTRASARELVIYLAMHPNGVTNEGWATALWPDRLMAPSSLHSTASVARRSLGQAADGRDHLPRSHGRLALASSVTTDWARFVALADSDVADDWKVALALVRGRPFEGLKSSDWPILEGIGPAIESAVVDLARRLGRSSLASGDAWTAEWAARRGLMVSPYDERLYRLLMRAADLDGNPAGVEGAMKELVALVTEDLEPFDSVHPSTMDLYRSLTRRRRPGPGRL
jgi:DNA-binding SARP family transcriptional activator